MPVTAATAGAKRKLTGSEKLTEIERAEALLRKGRLTQQQFEQLVNELLPAAGGEPPNATTFAAAGLLQLANKSKGGEGAAGTEEDAGAAGPVAGEAPQVEEPGAAAEQPEQPPVEPGVEPAVEEGAAEEGAQGLDPQSGGKKRRVNYQWKFETYFDTKEKAREYVKTQPHHYVLKHGKQGDIVFQCRSHVECTHHYRIYPFSKAGQFQVLMSGEHGELPATESVRGVPQHYRREVDPLLKTGWTPMAVLRFLESKYRGSGDLPSTDSLQNRKKTLQRGGKTEQSQLSYEQAAEVLAGAAGAMGGEDAGVMLGQDQAGVDGGVEGADVGEVAAAAADGVADGTAMGAEDGMLGAGDVAMQAADGVEGAEEQQHVDGAGAEPQWEQMQPPPPLTDGTVDGAVEEGAAGAAAEVI